MLAGLPMYDWPEISAATDQFWALLRACLLDKGFDAPETLTRQAELASFWRSPELLIGQTCGLPYATELDPHVRMVGTPAYDIGCAPGSYYSVLIAPKGGFAGLERFSGRIAVNDFKSQSGYAALMLSLSAAETAMDGVEMYLSSAHRASIEAVANGLADLAAIDAVSFTLAQRHMPEISEIEIVGCTRPTPGLPLISALPAEAVDRLASAVDEVIGSLSPSLRRELVLCGFVRRTAGDYAGIAEDWRHIGDHMLRQTQPSNQALQACR